jgi:tripartite-type tricarboxylate transporter receptor subunit TctC
MKKLNIFFVIMIALSMVLAACGNSSSTAGSSDLTKENFYENNGIEILVPFGAGGGTDLFARFMAPYIAENLAGSPAVQVINVPGGQTIVGTNEFAHMRENDGYNLLQSSASVHTPYLLGESAVKYDLKDLEPIFGAPTGAVVYVSPDTGVTEPADLKNLEEQLVFAGISAIGLDLVTLLSFEVLQLDVQSILGYEGRGPARVAFEQGEVNIDFQTTSAYLQNIEPLIDSGVAVPLYSLGQINEQGELVRDPVFPDLPTLKEVYIDIYGEEPSGEAWEAYKAFLNSSYTVQKVIWTHGDAPEAAIEALHESAEKIAKDPEFLEASKEVLENYEPYTGQELKNIIENALNTSPEILDWVRNLLEQKYDVVID